MKIEKIPINEIDVLIPRERDKIGHEMQALHIEKYGQIQPIKVALNSKKIGKKYSLVYGQGRLESAQRLGYNEVEAVVIENLNDIEQVEQWFTENNSRRDLSRYDIANILREEKAKGLSLQELSERFRLSAGYISLMIKVIKKASPRLKNKISKKTRYKRKTDKNHLRMNQAAEIVSSFENHEDQDSILETMERTGITSTKGVRTIINKAKELKEEGKYSTDMLIKSMTSIEDDLKNTVEKYYALFTQKEYLRKAYENLTDDQFFIKLAGENKLSLSIL